MRLLLLFRLFLTYVWISGYNDIKSLLFIGCVCVCGCYRWGDLLFVMLMATFMVLHNIYLMVSYAVAYMYFSFPQSVSNFMSKLTFRFISMPRLKNATKIPSSWSPAATFFFYQTTVNMLNWQLLIKWQFWMSVIKIWSPFSCWISNWQTIYLFRGFFWFYSFALCKFHSSSKWIDCFRRTW